MQEPGKHGQRRGEPGNYVNDRRIQQGATENDAEFDYLIKNRLLLRNRVQVVSLFFPIFSQGKTQSSCPCSGQKDQRHKMTASFLSDCPRAVRV